MLRALGDPVSLLLLVLGFVLAVTLSGWVCALATGRAGERSAAAEGRTSPDPRRHVEPFGAVAAGIAGIGWATPVQALRRERRGARAVCLLVGPAVIIVLGLLLLLGYRFTGGPPVNGALVSALQFGVTGVDLAQRALLLVGSSLLFIGVLSLVPLPPLNGGHLLFGLAPQTAGWRKAEHQLVERNIGVAVLLALLLIPLGGPTALLPTLLNTVVSPVAEAITGG